METRGNDGRTSGSVPRRWTSSSEATDATDAAPSRTSATTSLMQLQQQLATRPMMTVLCRREVNPSLVRYVAAVRVAINPGRPAQRRLGAIMRRRGIASVTLVCGRVTHTHAIGAFRRVTRLSFVSSVHQPIDDVTTTLRAQLLQVVKLISYVDYS